jgi:hypothetical protein
MSVQTYTAKLNLTMTKQDYIDKLVIIVKQKAEHCTVKQLRVLINSYK